VVLAPVLPALRPLLASLGCLIVSRLETLPSLLILSLSLSNGRITFVPDALIPICYGLLVRSLLL
jgi:hypothetical protein